VVSNAIVSFSRFYLPDRHPGDLEPVVRAMHHRVRACVPKAASVPTSAGGSSRLMVASGGRIEDRAAAAAGSSARRETL